jgi:Fungal specific transcription factor domain
VKPRQCKKKDSSAGLASDTFAQTLGRTEQTSDQSHQWPVECLVGELLDGISPDEIDTLKSPVQSSSLFAFPSAGLPQLYQIDPVPFNFTPDEAEEVEEVVRQPGGLSLTLVKNRSYHPDFAMIAPVPVYSPRLKFVMPAFSEFTDRPNRRALVDHFCNVLSHLIVFREESGNPFQQLVLPLCYKSSVCMNAIYALVSAHLEYRGVGNAEKSVSFHNQAIQGLARLIEQDSKADRNELLATIMLLVYYEVVGLEAEPSLGYS